MAAPIPSRWGLPPVPSCRRARLWACICLIAALIAWVFGGNIIASAVGTWAGNPISFPFIWLTTFNIGHLILGTEDKAGDLPELSLGLLSMRRSVRCCL